MLDVVRSATRRRALAAAFNVEILSLATANPPFRLPQSEAAIHARKLFPQLSKLWQAKSIGGKVVELGNTDPDSGRKRWHILSLIWHRRKRMEGYVLPVCFPETGQGP